MKKIVLTGGGTAGHVTPNIAIIPTLKEMGYDISYIGTYNGIEKKLIEEIGIPYYGISSGKLRRYFDLKNFTDPFRILKGYFQAKKLIKKLKPDVVFSKGGFVTVPVVFAASKKKIPIVIHESDMTPGLANKLALPKATKICCNFPETKKMFEGKATVTGTPIRAELFTGDKEKAKKFCGFKDDKSTILIVGGSTGSVVINNAIWEVLDELLKTYNVIHICGKDKTDSKYNGKEGEYHYLQHNFYIGGMDIEMFAPLPGYEDESNPFTDFLKENGGPGIHHINARLVNREEGIKWIRESWPGQEPPLYDLYHLGRNCIYFDMRKELGITVEYGQRIVGPRARFTEEELEKINSYRD